MSFDLICQKQTLWCWAACAEMAMAYYGLKIGDSAPRQCLIADVHPENTSRNCCASRAGLEELIVGTKECFRESIPSGHPCNRRISIGYVSTFLGHDKLRVPVEEELAGKETIQEQLGDLVCGGGKPVLIARKLAPSKWHLALVVGMRGTNYLLRDPIYGFEEASSEVLFDGIRPVDYAWVLNGARRLPACDPPAPVRNVVFHLATGEVDTSDFEMLEEMKVESAHVRKIPRYFVTGRPAATDTLEDVIERGGMREEHWALRAPDDPERLAVVLGRKYASPEHHRIEAARDSLIVDRLRQALARSAASGTSTKEGLLLDIPLFGMMVAVTGVEVGARKVSVLEARMSLDQGLVNEQLDEADFLKLLRRPQNLAGIVE